jgi:hypothetical protein
MVGVKVCHKHVYLDGGQGEGESDPYSLLLYTVAGENKIIIPNVLLIVHCV